MKVIEVLWSESHNSQISGVSEHLMLIIPAPHSQPLGCPKTTDNVKPNGKCYTVTCDWLPMFIKFLIFQIYIYHTLMGYLLQTKYFCSFVIKSLWMNKRKETHCVFPMVLYFFGLPDISVSEFSIGGTLEGNSSHLVSMPLMRKICLN